MEFRVYSTCRSAQVFKWCRKRLLKPETTRPERESMQQRVWRINKNQDRKPWPSIHGFNHFLEVCGGSAEVACSAPDALGRNCDVGQPRWWYDESAAVITFSVVALNWCRLQVEVRQRDIPAPGYVSSGGATGEGFREARAPPPSGNLGILSGVIWVYARQMFVCKVRRLLSQLRYPKDANLRDY